MLSYLNWQSIYTNKKQKNKNNKKKIYKKQNKNVFCSLTSYNVYAKVTKVAKLSNYIKSNNVYSASQMLYARLYGVPLVNIFEISGTYTYSQ